MLMPLFCGRAGALGDAAMQLGDADRPSIVPQVLTFEAICIVFALAICAVFAYRHRRGGKHPDGERGGQRKPLLPR